MKNYLVTGGSGFFGSILIEQLISLGHRCVNIDICPADFKHPNKTDYICDIRDKHAIDQIFRQEGPFDAVFHVAAMLAHSVKSKSALMETNVNGTRNIAESCIQHGTKHLVFISSNCLWGKPLNRPIKEDEPPAPIEIYGKSKVEAEKILLSLADRLHSVILRVPTITSEGRLGLLAIFYEFIYENRKIWMVGKGDNRYQFIYAPDLVSACIKASEIDRTTVYNVGSDNPKTLREIYQYVIDKAGSKSKIKSLPRRPMILVMKFANFLKLSPLGPYHYNMISESFEFDTSRAKAELGWQPTKSNEEMLFEAYNYFKRNYKEIKNRDNVSAHKKVASMGVIKLLKWIS